MAEDISPFWAGARRLAGRVDLEELATWAGGWRALERCGVAELEALGVSQHLAREWLERPAEQTLGLAITRADADYPARLGLLPDAPPVLCVEGDPTVLAACCVGVVGTRACTPYGAAVARHLGGAVAQRGGVVVSGLARGIDGHAHRAALDAGAGTTVAVLGHGLGCTSPRSHTALRRAIVEQGGAVVSGLPDEFNPTRWSFPQRNRWIAALSVVVAVIEAPLKSGALITAAEAASLDRPVFAVPAALGVTSSAGCLSLLADGARCIHDVDAFADEVVGALDPQLMLIDPLLEHLGTGAVPSEIARRAGMPVTDVLAKLARLEVRGDVVRLPGQRFVPSRGS